MSDPAQGMIGGERSGPAALAMIDLDQLEREALRVYTRYAHEVVEAFSFCPWAKGARDAGQVRIDVVTTIDPNVPDVLEVIERIGADLGADIGIVLFPRLLLDRIPFQRFVATLRVAYALRVDDGRGFAMAEFHPNAAADVSSPGRTLSFIRRTPDPTIQLVRLSALASVRKVEDQGTSYVDPASLIVAGPLSKRDRAPLNQRVGNANTRTIEEHGLDRVEAVMAQITEDRDRTYARLGLPPPAWRRAPGARPDA